MRILTRQHRHARRRRRCRRPAAASTYDGDARIDGVPGTSAPIRISFLDTAGSVCGKLLPTGHVVDTFDGVAVTCIDNGMPVVVIRAADLGRTGYETRDALNADTELKARLESIRLKAGPLMKLGDVTRKVVPKMSLIAPPRAGGSLCYAHLHSARLPLRGRRARRRDGGDGRACCRARWPTASPCCPPGDRKAVSVEHPTGEFTVELELDPEHPQSVLRAALLRTARLIMRGEVLIPRAVWDGKAALRRAA